MQMRNTHDVFKHLFTTKKTKCSHWKCDRRCLWFIDNMDSTAPASSSLVLLNSCQKFTTVRINENVPTKFYREAGVPLLPAKKNLPTKSAAGLLLRLKKFTENFYRCGPGLLPAKKNVPNFHFLAWTTTGFGTFS